MARGVKRLAEVALARSGAAGVWARWHRTRAVVLAYHNVVPEGEPVRGDVSLHLDRRDFGRQLDRLIETHDVVPLTELVDAVASGSRRPLAVVTFDDAYRGALTAGREELQARGLPATVFVCPGRLGSEGFWWDRLAGSDGLAADLRDEALGTLRGEQERILDRARRDGSHLTSLPDHARPVEEDELITIASGWPALSLASHTWSHPNLAALDASEVDRELSMSRGWLDRHGASAATWLAYPYGLTSPGVEAVAARHAEGALRVDGGAAHRDGDWTAGPMRLPRVNVPRGLSMEGLALRLAGLLADRS